MCFNYTCNHTRHQPGLIACALINFVIIQDITRTYHMCFNFPCYHTRHQPGLIACALIYFVIIQDTNQNLLIVLCFLPLLPYNAPTRTYCMWFNYPCYHATLQPRLITYALITLVIIQDSNQGLSYVLKSLL